MPSKNQAPKIQKTPSPKRGGVRIGAGRPAVYTLEEKLAIALRVAEVQQQKKISRSSALRIMQTSGELPLERISNITRYLTPKYLNPKIAAVLKKAPKRQGIIATISQPSKLRSRKK